MKITDFTKVEIRIDPAHPRRIVAMAWVGSKWHEVAMSEGKHTLAEIIAELEDWDMENDQPNWTEVTQKEAGE
jgi:hypothetical protein